MIVRTRRLVLRRAEPRDLGDLHAVYAHPEAMRYWSSLPDPDIAATEARLMRQMAQPEPATYLVLERDGRVIGNAGTYDFNGFGVILLPDHWGQGLMREALEALLPRAFEVSGAAFLLAEADPRNRASVGLMTRLGFEICGYAHRNYVVDGELFDTVYLRLDRGGPRGAVGHALCRRARYGYPECFALSRGTEQKEHSEIRWNSCVLPRPPPPRRRRKPTTLPPST